MHADYDNWSCSVLIDTKTECVQHHCNHNPCHLIWYTFLVAKKIPHKPLVYLQLAQRLWFRFILFIISVLIHCHCNFWSPPKSISDIFIQIAIVAF